METCGIPCSVYHDQHGTFQNRLISELRLAGAATVEPANAVLAVYLAAHNERFAQPAKQSSPAWRKLDRTL